MSRNFNDHRVASAPRNFQGNCARTGLPAVSRSAEQTTPQIRIVASRCIHNQLDQIISIRSVLTVPSEGSSGKSHSSANSGIGLSMSTGQSFLRHMHMWMMSQLGNI